MRQTTKITNILKIVPKTNIIIIFTYKSKVNLFCLFLILTELLNGINFCVHTVNHKCHPRKLCCKF